jgi:hypothetical protein
MTNRAPALAAAVTPGEPGANGAGAASKDAAPAPPQGTRIVIALARCLVHYEQVSADGFKIGEDTLITDVPLAAGVDVWGKMREGIAALEERVREMRADAE